MDGWVCNYWIGWEYSQTVQLNGTRNYCSAACAWFLPMPHDGIDGEGYPTAGHRSEAHPLWVYFFLPAWWCIDQQGIEDTCSLRLGRLDVGLRSQCFCGHTSYIIDCWVSNQGIWWYFSGHHATFLETDMEFIHSFYKLNWFHYFISQYYYISHIFFDLWIDFFLVVSSFDFVALMSAFSDSFVLSHSKNKTILQSHGFCIPSVSCICYHPLCHKCLSPVPRHHCTCPCIW